MTLEKKRGGRTERWHAGVNGYFGTASITRERAYWWVFALESFVMKMPIPAWRVPLVGRIKIRREWRKGKPETFTVEEWYGTELCCWWSMFVINPVVQWAHRRKVHRSITVPMRELMDRFGDEAPAFWREDWERGAEQWLKYGPPKADIREVLRADPREVQP